MVLSFGIAILAIGLIFLSTDYSGKAEMPNSTSDAQIGFYFNQPAIVENIDSNQQNCTSIIYYSNLKTFEEKKFCRWYE